MSVGGRLSARGHRGDETLTFAWFSAGPPLAMGGRMDTAVASSRSKEHLQHRQSRKKTGRGTRQRTTRPLAPPPRAVLVIGERATETSALLRAFGGHAVTLSLAASKEEAKAMLASQRWKWVMLDARWEEDLLDHARAGAEAVRCYVTDPKRVYGRNYQPIPLGQADVEEILGT